MSDVLNWQEIEQIKWEGQGPEFAFQPFFWLKGYPGLTQEECLQLSRGETIEHTGQLEQTKDVFGLIQDNGQVWDYLVRYKRRVWKLREALGEDWIFFFKLLKDLEDHFRQGEALLPEKWRAEVESSPVRVVAWFDN